MCLGDSLRRKQALKAAAQKWFPYGHGPAKDSTFVIEDVAEVSNDEEEYGDFQVHRAEGVDEAREERLRLGGHWLDEYQGARNRK